MRLINAVVDFYARFWLAFAFWLWLHYSWRLAWAKADRRPI